MENGTVKQGLFKRAARYAVPAVLAGLLIAIGELFVPECDDCYFVFWQFASWKHLLLTQPITSGAKVVGVPFNGRYLGNLLGVLLSKLYGTPFGFLRGLVMGGSIAVLIFLLVRWISPGKRREGFMLIFTLVVLAPRGIWQQVFSWGAAMANYLFPMVGVLLLMELFPRGRWGALLCLPASAACCLFMEPITIMLCVGGAVCAGFTAWRAKKYLPAAAATLAGAVFGALVMFSYPGYWPENGGRPVNFERVGKNLNIIAAEALVRPAAVAIVISALLVWLLRRQGREWKIYAIPLLPIHLLCLYENIRDLTRIQSIYTGSYLWLGVPLAALWVIMLVRWQGGACRLRIFAAIGVMCLLDGPMLLVSSIYARTFFAHYVVLLWIVCQLWSAARQEGAPHFKQVWVVGLAACLALIFIYGSNYRVYCDRLATARAQVAQGEQTVTLPLVPYRGWTSNENPGKGDISYLVYRDTPWDVGFEFVPYKEWTFS